jgi:hypothetical protein
MMESNTYTNSSNTGLIGSVVSVARHAIQSEDRMPDAMGTKDTKCDVKCGYRYDALFCFQRGGFRLLIHCNTCVLRPFPGICGSPKGLDSKSNL